MTEYYKVDERWDLFNITSQEEYIERFVVEGYFHPQVPKDVIDAFLTVSNLTAQAYFYYPLYDEAFNKALRILEMAIKSKATQLGISLTTTNKKNKKLTKTLDEIIKAICKHECYANLNHTLDRARRIRNNQMHPHGNSFMGVTSNVVDNIKLIVNTLNSLFQSSDWLIDRASIKESLHNDIKKFEDYPFVIESGKPLLSKIIGIEVYEKSILILLDPIRLNLKDSIEKQHSLKPTQLELTDYKIKPKGFEGKNEKGENVVLSQSSHARDLKKYDDYQKDLSNMGDANNHIYHYLVLSGCDWLPVIWEYNIHKKNQIIKSVDK